MIPELVRMVVLSAGIAMFPARTAVEVHWDAPGVVTAYKVYCGSQSGVYDPPVTVTGTTYRPRHQRTVFCSVSAIMPDGSEGPLSPELSMDHRSVSDVRPPHGLRLVARKQ